MRVTVKLKYPGETTERDFHLSPEKAERFATKARNEGAAARIVPFEMSAELRAMLGRAGVNPANIR